MFRESLTLGLALAEADPEGETDGLTELLGEAEALGLAELDALRLSEELGEREAEGLKLALPDIEDEADDEGDFEPEGLKLAEGEADFETDDDGLAEAEGD